MTASSLLLIEDNPGDARLLREMFAEDGTQTMELMQVGCMRDAEKLLTERVVDIILLDLGLPDTEGLGAVQRAHAAAPRIPLVVLTGLDDESMALLALQEGAQDYLVKGRIESRGLLRALRYAIERKLMEEALFAEKERAQVTLDCIGDAVICADVSGNITFLNFAAEQMNGWHRDDAAGRPISEVFQMLDATSREIIPILPEDRAVDGLVLQTRSNCVLVRRDGVEVSVEDSVAGLHDRGGRATGVVVVFRDVSAIREASLRMAHSAQHDYLTGLPNRMLLNDRISQAIVLARRHGKQAALLFLDVDGFKHINDSLGHSIGDRLLQSIATRLVDCARASDTVSRQGGDEFVVLLSEMEQPEDAAIAATRILKAVSAAHRIDEHELHVTTSIGVSVYPDDGLDAETLIKNADTAMYQAKENGRQSYQFFTPGMNARAVKRQSIEQDLRRALQRNELTLHYQPKIDFKTGAISGAEALLRWTHPTRGAVSPAEFIPVAEDCGLILPIGRWVLRKACEQARAWADAGLNVGSMAVNVSAREFRNEGFLAGLFAILDDTGLDPRSLELELTESVLMRQAEPAAAILRHLRDRGVQVAIDDFGTGYSSLSYLRKFPVDALKIDQSFVNQISSGGGDTTIVTAVISMARSLGLRVVAEGVETVEQLAFLQGQNCDEAQGYYFSRPVPAEQFATLLTRGLPASLRGACRGLLAVVPEPAGDLTRTVKLVEGLRDSNDELKRLVASGERLLHDCGAKNDELVELGRFKDEVAAMIVHDLKNPLAVILSNSDFVIEGFDGSSERREALEESQTAARRILRLLANLDDVARLEGDTLEVRVSPIDLARLLRSIVEQRRVSSATRQVAMIMKPGEGCFVTVDVDLVTRTVENILDNAFRYVPEGGRIEIELRETEAHVEIRIGNSGPPIPAEARVAIFEKYGQSGVRLGRRNLGLGLYFCRLAAEAQGGRISVDETETLPALFTVSLPRLVTLPARRPGGPPGTTSSK